jgi:uncharacterized membrane protein
MMILATPIVTKRAMALMMTMAALDVVTNGVMVAVMKSLIAPAVGLDVMALVAHLVVDV